MRNPMFVYDDRTTELIFDYCRARLALARAQDAAQTAIAAFKLGQAQFGLGAVDYTTVLNAQQEAAQQALNLVQARTNLLLDIARLQSAMAQ